MLYLYEIIISTTVSGTLLEVTQPIILIHASISVCLLYLELIVKWQVGLHELPATSMQ